MDKITKAFRVKSENVKKVKKLAKDNRRNIGDTLDLIIEYYFENHGTS
ncbi:MAG: hypothetical protein HC803_01780 [Saprospiraceae bacterium]|nr:hypothetical protein [Saprospiraceae bacterium]